MASEEDLRVVRKMWDDLFSKRFAEAAAAMADDGLYEDVPTPDPGAIGPAAVEKRLRIGLDPIERFDHEIHRIVAEGGVVVLEHTEVWHFPTGEVMRNPFVTVHVLENGKIKLWRDYWDLNTLMSQVPKWWIERLAGFSETDFAPEGERPAEEA